VNLMTATLPPEINLRRFYSDLRYPTERSSLWITLLVLALIVLLFSIFSFGTALLLLVFVFWTVSFLVRINHSRQVGNAVRVGANQFPELAVQIARAAEVVRVPPVQVFVHQEDKINAYAFGWDSPQAVVLTSGAVEHLDDDEIRFVVGHEMGHIAMGHTRLTSLIGGMLGAPNIPVISTLLMPIFLWWSRSAEYSADRAGLIACGDLDQSASALVKLLVGPKLAAQVDIEEIIAQSQELNQPRDNLGELSALHPYLVHRIRKLVQFWHDPECQELLQLAHQPTG
jgi:Zn-dependent protease with chaperone function